MSRIRDLYSESFELFRKGCGVHYVAFKLGIDLNKARAFKNHYLWDRQEAKQFLLSGYERQRKETVEKFLDKAKAESGEIRNCVNLVRKFFPDAARILILFSGGKRVARWEPGPSLY